MQVTLQGLLGVLCLACVYRKRPIVDQGEAGVLYLMEHEGDHERPHNTGRCVDAQVNTNEDGVEYYAGLQHESSNVVARIVGCLCFLLLTVGNFGI